MRGLIKWDARARTAGLGKVKRASEGPMNLADCCAAAWVLVWWWPPNINIQASALHIINVRMIEIRFKWKTQGRLLFRVMVSPACVSWRNNRARVRKLHFYKTRLARNRADNKVAFYWPPLSLCVSISSHDKLLSRSNSHRQLMRRHQKSI
jgi:hypothetical protein